MGLALCIGLIARFTVNAQCSGTLATHTYDTTLSSSGFGIFPISIPKWSPDSGLLVSVKLAAKVSSQYGYTLRNAASDPATYALTLGQWDQISGAALSTPYSNILSQNVDSFSLAPGQSVSNGPFTFLNEHVSSDSITGNVAPFMGTGNVGLNYMSFTFTDLNSYNNATYYYNANIANTMHFTVSYLYCQDITVLAVSLTDWSAQLAAPQTAELKWSAVNETDGRSYDLQRSGDGKTFMTVHSFPALKGQTSDYDYTDNLPASTTGTWFYRLQIHDQSGVSLSAVKELNVGVTPDRITGVVSPVLYPNPSDTYVNVNTGGGVATDWEADVMASNGTVVQRNSFQQTTLLNIPFNTRLASGEYFLRLTDLKRGQTYTRSFVVVHGN
ncbi:MAG TPA: T9SS type A sorting domain-containing protein [Puia sp.]|nr:T9SS type A sorting domain-containing protein [Puia sp.]